MRKLLWLTPSEAKIFWAIYALEDGGKVTINSEDEKIKAIVHALASNMAAKGTPLSAEAKLKAGLNGLNIFLDKLVRNGYLDRIGDEKAGFRVLVVKKDVLVKEMQSREVLRVSLSDFKMIQAVIQLEEILENSFQFIRELIGGDDPKAVARIYQRFLRWGVIFPIDNKKTRRKFTVSSSDFLRYQFEVSDASTADDEKEPEDEVLARLSQVQKVRMVERTAVQDRLEEIKQRLAVLLESITKKVGTSDFTAEAKEHAELVVERDDLLARSERLEALCVAYGLVVEDMASSTDNQVEADRMVQETFNKPGENKARRILAKAWFRRLLKKEKAVLLAYILFDGLEFPVPTLKQELSKYFTFRGKTVSNAMRDWAFRKENWLVPREVTAADRERWDLPQQTDHIYMFTEAGKVQMETWLTNL